MKKKEKKQKDHFRRELESYEKEGIMLWLNGNKSSAKEIQKAHKIAEENSYMRDYVRDDQGNLMGIGFDKITH